MEGSSTSSFTLMNHTMEHRNLKRNITQYKKQNRFNRIHLFQQPIGHYKSTSTHSWPKTKFQFIHSCHGVIPTNARRMRSLDPFGWRNARSCTDHLFLLVRKSPSQTLPRVSSETSLKWLKNCFSQTGTMLTS